MADPTTSNIALNVPITGSNVGTWGDISINPDMVAIDGMLGGVATVGLSNTNVTLTKPAASIAPTAGPFQSQNSVLQFTGVLTSNVTVTLPLPGKQLIANFTTGNFVVSFRAVGSGAVIATPQGSVMEVYNDGTDVRFVGNVSSYPGKQEFLSGVSALPAWMSACTTSPFLLADGTIKIIADFPSLAALYGTTFGGNGLTTFGLPDLQGRVPIAYDGTGTRITTAGCGINGQTLGATGGTQDVTLDLTQIPSHNHGGVTSTDSPKAQNVVVDGGALNNVTVWRGNSSGTEGLHSHTISSAGGGQPHRNVQPSIVAGIWLIKT